MNEFDFGWLCGLIEGDGCFTNTNSPRIVIGMTDHDTVKRAAELMEGRLLGPYQPGGNRKPVWKAMIGSWQALSLMIMVKPHMSARRQQKINEILLENQKDSSNYYY